MKRKIYCFNNSWSPGMPRHEWNSGVALADDGVCVAGHCSSSPEWCKIDITGKWKHDKFDEHCGKDNWEIVWIDDARKDKITDEGFLAAIALSDKLLAEGKQKDERASVGLEMSDGTVIEKRF